ncbi:MAG: TPM domain-containing protein [Cyclobacteriaceae bacterium]|nr:TPM domain-containing protein [Cyclobacteriaceae bacterium]
MANIEDILSAGEEEEIVEAIRQAEKTTSGEIRIHIERTAPEEAIERAAEVFHFLKMDNTRERNGVLIYVAVESRVFVIFGDKGINEVVPPGFWDTTRDIMLKHFKEGDYKQGIIEGVLKSGEQLQKYFPWKHGDDNELPDEISKG